MATPVQRIGEITEPPAFERIHGAFFGWVIARDAKAATHASVARYIEAIG